MSLWIKLKFQSLGQLMREAISYHKIISTFSFQWVVVKNTHPSKLALNFKKFPANFPAWQ